MTRVSVRLSVRQSVRLLATSPCSTEIAERRITHSICIHASFPARSVTIAVLHNRQASISCLSDIAIGDISSVQNLSASWKYVCGIQVAVSPSRRVSD